MEVRTTLLAVGLLALPLVAQSEARALGEYRRLFFSKNQTAKVAAKKNQALSGLHGHDSARVAKALVSGYVNLEQEAEPLRQKRRSALMRGGGSNALNPHRLKLQPIRNLQRKITVALSELKSVEALQAMLRALITRKAKLPMMLEIAIAKRAGDLSEEGLRLLLEASEAPAKKSKIKRARHALPLLAALRHAGRRAVAAAPWAVSQLQHEYADVRVEAARALTALAWPGSITALINRAKLEQGRALDAMFDALTALTGQDPGRSASAWGRWLAKEGGPYVEGKIRLGGGVEKPARRPQKRRPEQSGTGSYFGIPQDGNSILYVFDNSQSMKAAMPGAGKAEKKVTRMDRCREELHRALDKLTPQKRFNLLAFANKLRMFAETMQPASKSNIAKAHEWIDGLKLEFQTNIHDALELSFYIAGRGTEDRYYALEADTLFFLSDGAPTIKKPKGRGIQRDNITEILAAVRQWNPLQRMVIHTIGLGVQRGRAARPTAVHTFMKELARHNGGKFVIPK